MPHTIHAQPDTNPVLTGTTTVPAGHGWRSTAWAQIVNWANAIPGWTWAIALSALALITIVALPLARTQARKAGARINGKVSPADRKDRRLLAAVLTPAVLFWLAVLVGSGRSLIQFGRDDLGWAGGWELLVPFTLDGVAVAFGALAFRAIAKERNPDRAYRVVWMATAASAGINFFHEVGGSTLGAGYLAILSLFGMLIFHELLAQFEEGAAWIKRTNPKFGLRWLTWPTNTMCAWIAWRNYPPAEGTQASIGLAVEHLDGIRRAKTERRAAEVDSPVWWMRFAPWVSVRSLRVALETERAALEAERAAAADAARKLSATVTELSSRVDRQAASLEQERVSAATSTHQLQDELKGLRAQRTADMERLTAQHAKDLRAQQETLTAANAEALRAQREELLAEMREKVTAAKAEASLPHLDERRNRVSAGTSKTAAKTSPKTPISDEAAVQKLLSHPGDPEKNIPSGDLRDWSQKAITEEVGVGYSRAPRLLEAVTEAQRQLRSETPSGDLAVNQ